MKKSNSKKPHDLFLWREEKKRLNRDFVVESRDLLEVFPDWQQILDPRRGD